MEYRYLNSILIILIYSSIFIAVEANYNDSCDYTSEDGRWVYNLTNYKKAFDYLKSDISSTTNVTYYYVPCNGFSKDFFPVVCTDSAICARSGPLYWSAGSYHSPKKSDAADPAKGLTITYSNGSSCYHRRSLLSSFAVQLICHLPKNADDQNDESDGNNGTIRETVDPTSAYSFVTHVNDSDPCNVTMTVFSPIACPTNRDPDPKCHGLSKDSCLVVEGCYCHICGGVCMAYYEECDAERIYMCNHNNIGTRRMAFHGFYFHICVISAFVALCACSVGCISRRKKLQMDNDMKKVMEDDLEDCEEMNNISGLPECVLSRYSQSLDSTHSLPQIFDNLTSRSKGYKILKM